ncbi:MAG: neutral/alkaline non-lysosomal ceramidase N-terminal domain-containing protein [Candidatus Sericytochromatia bacterium]
MQAGAAKNRIRVDVRGMGMMGYGAPHNTVEYAHGDLFARACVFRDAEGHWSAFVNLEICFITQALHQAVLEQLATVFPELTAHNLLLTAQHTHSAPGGHSHYMFYNVTVPGFQPDIFQAMLNATVESLLQARQRLQAAHLSFGRAAFPEHEEVAFNRSLEAYNANPENAPLAAHQTHLAIDREMALLKVSAESGSPLAVITWFGVHATNLGPENQGMSADNKGFAALALEQSYLQQGDEVVAIFAQAAAGDVSPNFYGSAQKGRRGKFDSELESARFNGHLQARQAQRILAQPLRPLSAHVAGVLSYADLSKVDCDPRFTGGQTGCHTTPAAHGVAFLKGTTIDGQGISAQFATAIAAYCQLQRAGRMKRLQSRDPEAFARENAYLAMQAPKVIAIETGKRRFLGLEDLTQLPIPDRLEPLVAELRRLAREHAIDEHSWTPQVLPLQLLRLGELVLVGFPGELTTTAARRLREALSACLPGTEIVLSCYANAYFGYATTPEEYLLQAYEGGHTVFGRWTLPAFQTLFAQLAPALDAEAAPALSAVPRFSETEISRRTGKPARAR